MSRLSSRVFWQATAETTIGYASAGAATALTAVANPSLQLVLVGIGVGAALGFSKSLSSLKVQPDNGTSSFLPRVVAAPKPDHGDG